MKPERLYQFIDNALSVAGAIMLGLASVWVMDKVFTWLLGGRS